MNQGIYSIIEQKRKKNLRSFAILIDPDKQEVESLEKVVSFAQKEPVDFFFVGGSLLTNGRFSNTINYLKSKTQIPIVIFPGSTMQISKDADAILFLSLISGRNPEMLIGRHVLSAPDLKCSGIEVISTGYMLIDSGKQTSVSYMSNSTPIPYDKPDIAACTALAGEMLGMKLIYMDGGSGAHHPISEAMIKMVRSFIDIPLIVGGGIKTPEKVRENLAAGADIIVVGNALEGNIELIAALSNEVKRFNDNLESPH